MTQYHPALGYKTPHSMTCPYHMALYLHSLVKAADHLVDNLEAPPMVGYPSADEMGLPGLMTIICERADALSQMLERLDPEGWAVAQEALRQEKVAAWIAEQNGPADDVAHCS